MGYELIAHEAEGRMSYWFRGYEGKRNINFVLVKNPTSWSRLNIFRRLKLDMHQSFFTAKTLQIWRALFATSRL